MMTEGMSMGQYEASFGGPHLGPEEDDVLSGGFQKTAAAAAEQLAQALEAQARKVARLESKRRKLRKDLKDVNDSLREARRFMRGLAQDRTEAAPRGKRRSDGTQG